MSSESMPVTRFDRELGDDLERARARQVFRELAGNKWLMERLEQALDAYDNEPEERRGGRPTRCQAIRQFLLEVLANDAFE